MLDANIISDCERRGLVGNIKAFLADLVAPVQPENATTDFWPTAECLLHSVINRGKALLEKLQYRWEKGFYGHFYSSWTVPIGHIKLTHEFLHARMSPSTVRTRLTMQAECSGNFFWELCIAVHLKEKGTESSNLLTNEPDLKGTWKEHPGHRIMLRVSMWM